MDFCFHSNIFPIFPQPHLIPHSPNQRGKMIFLLLAPLLDLGFNAATFFLHLDQDLQLMLVFLQDTLQVLAILGLAVRFSSTFAFQVGLIGHILRRFSASIFSALLYLVLSIFFHFLSLKNRWANFDESSAAQSHNFVWSIEMTILFVAQRTASILHYFLYKRTILMLNDPKYHQESSDWLLQKIGQKSVVQ